MDDYVAAVTRELAKLLEPDGADHIAKEYVTMEVCEDAFVDGATPDQCADGILCAMADNA